MHCGNEVVKTGKFCEHCGKEILTEPSKVSNSDAKNRPVSLKPENKKCNRIAIILTVIITAALFVFLFQTKGYIVQKSMVESDIKQIVIESSKSVIAVDEKINLKAKARLIDNKEINISDGTQWNSTNPKVARIAQNGELTGLEPGVCKIQLDYKGFLTEIQIRVNQKNQNEFGW